jgi:hypothetical protein
MTLRDKDLQPNLRSSHAKPSIILRFINDTLNNIIIIVTLFWNNDIPLTLSGNPKIIKHK